MLNKSILPEHTLTGEDTCLGLTLPSYPPLSESDLKTKKKKTKNQLKNLIFWQYWHKYILTHSSVFKIVKMERLWQERKYICWTDFRDLRCILFVRKTLKTIICQSLSNMIQVTSLSCREVLQKIAFNRS